MTIDKNTKIYLGQTEIVKIKKGNVVIWEKSSGPTGPDYFYMQNISQNNDTLNIYVEDTEHTLTTVDYTATIEYSRDKSTWTTLNLSMFGDHFLTLNAGEKIYFRNNNGRFSVVDERNTSNRHFISFKTNEHSAAGGDILTLVDYENIDTYEMNKEGMFNSLFYSNSALVDASDLTMPSTLYRNCFNSMFNGCSSLTSVPTLPATTLKPYCYNNMFYGCSSLTSAPSLPATDLKYNCYSGMFASCSSLTSAPSLPSTDLAMNCYQSMFDGCTALTIAPALPATTLASSCYSAMFRDCTSLTTPPELPATTLAENCYDYMFQGCTSLVTAPILPATTLKNYCYRNMFNGCTSLNNVTSYAQNISATDCTKNWLENVAAEGTLNNVNFATYTSGPSGIPSGWTEVTPTITSITASPNTYNLKSYQKKVTANSTLTVVTNMGTFTKNDSQTITVGENTGDSTRTLTETIPYKSSSYQITIVQTANDPKPSYEWEVVSTGTYPFELNSNNYYESTNKGHDNSYSYATLNYEGFDELVLECINFAESYYDYGIISQPDVQLSQSYSDDGATGSANVFLNFNGKQSANPVQLTIPSDGAEHFITIKFRKDSSSSQGNDSLQFKVVEP